MSSILLELVDKNYKYIYDGFVREKWGLKSVKIFSLYYLFDVNGWDSNSR